MEILFGPTHRDGLTEQLYVTIATYACEMFPSQHLTNVCQEQLLL